ncbi:MAG: helix-turn-helix domain-containing protein [Burkholderiaceae bacterium]
MARTQNPGSPPRTQRRRPIPAFDLYGEQVPAGATGVEMLHIEEIRTRSRLHDWEIGVHVHRGLYQLIWLRRGRIEAQLDESRAQADGPAAVVVPPGVVHAFRFSPEADGQVLTISPRAMIEGDVPAIGEAVRSLFGSARVLVPASRTDTGRIDALVGQLAAEFALVPESPLPPWLARCLVWRLARTLATPDAGERRPAHSRHQALYTRFQVLVEAHHAEHWPVSRYAARLGLTPERLNRIVRTACGRTALEVVHERLVREARRRLVYLSVPISTIGFELGFDDPAYFCRFFKRHTGRSPRRFRAEAASE